MPNGQSYNFNDTANHPKPPSAADSRMEKNVDLETKSAADAFIEEAFEFVHSEKPYDAIDEVEYWRRKYAKLPTVERQKVLAVVNVPNSTDEDDDPRMKILKYVFANAPEYIEPKTVEGKGPIEETVTTIQSNQVVGLIPEIDHEMTLEEHDGLAKLVVLEPVADEPVEYTEKMVKPVDMSGTSVVAVNDLVGAPSEKRAAEHPEPEVKWLTDAKAGIGFAGGENAEKVSVEYRQFDDAANGVETALANMASNLDPTKKSPPSVVIIRNIAAINRNLVSLYRLCTSDNGALRRNREVLPRLSVIKDTLLELNKTTGTHAELVMSQSTGWLSKMNELVEQFSSTTPSEASTESLNPAGEEADTAGTADPQQQALIANLVKDDPRIPFLHGKVAGSQEIAKEQPIARDFGLENGGLRELLGAESDSTVVTPSAPIADTRENPATAYPEASEGILGVSGSSGKKFAKDRLSEPTVEGRAQMVVLTPEGGAPVKWNQSGIMRNEIRPPQIDTVTSEPKFNKNLADTTVQSTRPVVVESPISRASGTAETAYKPDLVVGQSVIEAKAPATTVDRTAEFGLSPASDAAVTTVQQTGTTQRKGIFGSLLNRFSRRTVAAPLKRGPDLVAVNRVVETKAPSTKNTMIEVGPMAPGHKPATLGNETASMHDLQGYNSITDNPLSGSIAEEPAKLSATNSSAGGVGESQPAPERTVDLAPAAVLTQPETAPIMTAVEQAPLMTQPAGTEIPPVAVADQTAEDLFGDSSSPQSGIDDEQKEAEDLSTRLTTMIDEVDTAAIVETPQALQTVAVSSETVEKNALNAPIEASISLENAQPEQSGSATVSSQPVNVSNTPTEVSGSALDNSVEVASSTTMQTATQPTREPQKRFSNIHDYLKWVTKSGTGAKDAMTFAELHQFMADERDKEVAKQESLQHAA